MLAGLQRTFGIDPARAVRQAAEEAARHRAVRRAGARQAPAARARRARRADARSAQAAAKDPFGADFEGVIPNLRRRFEEGHVDRSGRRSSRTARCGRARRATASGCGPRAAPCASRAAGCASSSTCRSPTRCRVVRGARTDRARAAHRRPRPARDSRPAAVPGRRRRRLPHARRAAPRRCRAAKASASGSPRRSDRS